MELIQNVADWAAERPWTTELMLPLVGISLSLVCFLWMLGFVRHKLIAKQLLTTDEARKDSVKLKLIVIGVHLAFVYNVDTIETLVYEWPTLMEVTEVLGALGLCLAVYVVTRRVLLDLLAVLVKRSRVKWDDVVLEHGAMNKLSFLAPIAVATVYTELIPVSEEVIGRVLSIAVVVVLILAAADLLNAVNDLYTRNVTVARGRPIKGYVQIVKLFVYLVGAVVIVAFAIGKSPVVLLAGVGAATAVLLLIFKNTILSLVASIQMASNDMLRIGDWIEMDKQNANGFVVDIALHTVKVKNWDHSTAYVPTFKLIEESFNNWRGMWDSGGRRIKRALHFDQGSIRFCDAALLSRLEKIELLGGYLERKLDEIAEQGHERNARSLVDRRALTNLGVYRAYATAYLEQHPIVDKNDYLMVRQLDPGPQGVPLQVYCYLTITKWVAFEGIQGDIIDHLLAIIPEFDLRIYQDPTGADFRGEPPNPGLQPPPRPGPR